MVRKRRKLRQISIDQFYVRASNDGHSADDTAEAGTDDTKDADGHSADDTAEAGTDDTKDAGSSPMNYDNPFAVLPRSIMVHILEFLYNCRPANDIPVNKYRRSLQGLISLASCDKYLENLIYTGCPFLWEVINLNHIATSLIDSQLEFHLKRTNALNVTRELRLCCCPLVTGTELTPLIGSQTLELVDLTTPSYEDEAAERTDLNDIVVSRVLISMLPYDKLTSVYLPSDELYASGQRHLVSFPMQDFLIRFELAKARRLFDDQTLCGYCGCLLCNLVTTDKVLTICYESKPTKCEICGTHSCSSWSESSCPPIQKCYSCKAAYCKECGYECLFCTTGYCKRCQIYRQCDQCKFSCCDDCGYTRCDYCERYRCEQCDDCTVYMECDRCGRCSCPPCRNFADLSCIASTGNAKCRFDGHCHRCAGVFGDECTLEDDCEYCLRKFCSDCSPHKCISPGEEFAFDGYGRCDAVKAKKCSCGKNTLCCSRGQQFMCSFIIH